MIKKYQIISFIIQYISKMEHQLTLTDQQIVVERLPLENNQGNVRKNLTRTSLAAGDDTDGTEADTGDSSDDD